MSWRWVSLAALLAGVVLGFNAFTSRDAAQVSTSEPPPPPGYYLNDAVVTRTQADGAPGLRLVAKHIEQHPSDNSYTLSPVRVDYFQAPGKQWQLTAERGFVPADSRVVQLRGDVDLRPVDPGRTAFLRTDAVAIDTERNVAYSLSSPVTLRFGQHEMKVKSFEADLNSEKIRLESANGSLRPQ
jgi:lipopolysaccharide export system protein LptC